MAKRTHRTQAPQFAADENQLKDTETHDRVEQGSKTVKAPSQASQVLLNRVHWALTGFCLLAVCVLPTTSAAQPEGSTAPPMVADAKQAQKKHRRLVRELKESIRESFKTHDGDIYWQIYGAKVDFIFGRTQTPDKHDYLRTRKQQSHYLKYMWKTKTTGHEDVFFREIKITENPESIELYVDLSFHFFGGSKRESRSYRYTREESDSKWKVSLVRSWKTAQSMGPDLKKYTAAFWAEADVSAKRAVTSAQLDLHTRLSYLIEACWITSALDVAQETVAHDKKNAEAWKAIGALSFELGRFTDSKRAISKARQINPNISLPEALR